METLKTGPWIIRYDKEDTARRYALAQKGGPEECGCEHCRNFVAARDKVYPEEARRIFDTLGIDCHKEAEVYHVYRIRPGWHSYSGHLHFMGSIEYVGSNETGTGKDVKLTDGFSWVFYESWADPRLDVFGRDGVSEIIFTAEVPWVLNAPEPM